MRNYWYVALEAKQLKSNRPLSVKVLDEDIVLFKDSTGAVQALVDRCPHRNVPLSLGKVKRGQLQCPYHGWTFNGSGECTHIPVLTDGAPIPKPARCQSYPVRESQGYVWVWIGDEEPQSGPFQIPYFQQKGWTLSRFSADIDNSAENCIENFIDNPHTSYVHGGLFRTPDGHLSHTLVRRKADQIVIDIKEEVSTNSLFSKVFIRPGESVYHQDRFILPTTVQVAYGFGERYKITGFLFCTPVSDFKTKVFVHVTWNLGFWLSWIKFLVPFFGRVIFNQDKKILEAQARVIRKHGEQFTSTAADTANLWIRALRRKGEGDPEKEETERPVVLKL